MVLAGAGSGKTRVLTHRVAWLVEHLGVDPSEIVLLTFTNKAAREMSERVLKLGSSMKLGFSGTFHTFCARLIRTYGNRVGMPRDFLIYDSDDSEALMKRVIKDLKYDPKEVKPRVCLSIISRMKNDLVDIETGRETAKDPFYKQIYLLWQEYQKRLKKNKAVDFDDLLVLAVSLLKIDDVKKVINKQFKWILIDEYQDTNKAQFEITRLITGENYNLTVVGDAAQAIYSFRGADFRNLLLLESEYPKLTKINLPRNYRSTQNILDGAWGVIKNNKSHPVIKLSSEAESGDSINLYEAADEKDEAKFVVNSSRHEEDVVVLYRTNAQSRSFEDELIRRGIPYRLVGGLRFYNRAEIKDLIAYLRLTVNRDDEVSKERAEKIGKRKLYKFSTWIEDKTDVANLKPSKLLDEIISCVDYLDKFDERDEEDAGRIENINELLAVAEEYDTVQDFLENASLSESEDRQSGKEAKITLMTIHAAKGLEFDNVFIVGLEEGIFPHSRTLMNRDEIEEERRLMYVAMTRAKKKLTTVGQLFTRANARWDLYRADVLRILGVSDSKEITDLDAAWSKIAEAMEPREQ